VAQVVCLLVIGILAAPVCLGLAGAAGRFALPLATFLVGGLMVFAGRISLFVVFVLWLFTLAPLIRRLTDFAIGWQEPNAILLAPYTAALWSLFAVPTLMVRRDIPFRWYLVAIIAAICYGLAISIAGSQLVSGLLNWLVWVVPPAILALLLASDEPAETLLRHVEAFFVLAVLGTSVYGIHQFFAVRPWDAFWMINSEMGSIGVPLPTEVRVFSTLNSPGPFASFLAAGLLFLLARPGPLRGVVLALGMAAFALSMVRTAWVGFALGVVVLFVLGEGRLRLKLAAALAVATVGMLAIGIHPEVGPVLRDRLESLTNLAGDVSARERLENYGLLASIANERVFGHGLAASENFTESTGEYRAIDSGLIEMVMALGVIVATVYLVAIGLTVLGSLSASLTAPWTKGGAAAAAAVGLGILGGSVTVGVVGTVMFVAMAPALMTLRRSRDLPRADPVGARARGAGPQRRSGRAAPC